MGPTSWFKNVCPSWWAVAQHLHCSCFTSRLPFLLWQNRGHKDFFLCKPVTRMYRVSYIKKNSHCANTTITAVVVTHVQTWETTYCTRINQTVHRKVTLDVCLRCLWCLLWLCSENASWHWCGCLFCVFRMFCVHWNNLQHIAHQFAFSSPHKRLFALKLKRWCAEIEKTIRGNEVSKDLVTLIEHEQLKRRFLTWFKSAGEIQSVLLFFPI